MRVALAALILLGAAPQDDVVKKIVPDADKIKKVAKKLPPAGQAKVEKMPNDVVRVTMTSQTAFDTNSTVIKPSFHSTLDKLSDVMTRYNKTTLTVVGAPTARVTKRQTMVSALTLCRPTFIWR